MPCPHFDVKIIQRSKRQSAVASAAYQSGERLFSEYDQKQKYYSHKSEIVHTEIMLPPHAPPEYADRNTLWNAAEAIEKQWNSQLARRFVLAIPRELPRSQYADLIRDYCREFFVSKGMIADFAIHDKGDGNPHAHILLTMRAMDETGKWLPKSRKVYDLDENGKRKLVAKMLKAIHAQESKKAAREKAKAVVEELRSMKLKEAAKKVEDSIDETLTYCDFPSEHWTRIRTNNVIERLNREIRRRTRVVGSFPDGNSALMLVCARLRHVAGTQWGNKKYMNMKHLEAAIEDVSIAG